MFDILAARLWSFAGRFLVTFALLVTLWPLVSPIYARAVASLGGPLLNATSLSPPGSRLEARNRRVWIFRPVTKVDGSLGMAGVNVLDDATYFNFVLLVSLIAATPSLGLGGKAKAFCLGAGILALLHLADLVVKLRWTAIYPGLRLHGIIPEAASPVVLKSYEWLYALFSVLGFGLFPILVWIGVVSLWWPRGGGASPTPRAGRQ